MLGMSMEEQAGVVLANKKLAERRFKNFVREIEEEGNSCRIGTVRQPGTFKKKN